MRHSRSLLTRSGEFRKSPAPITEMEILLPEKKCGKRGKKTDILSRCVILNNRKSAGGRKYRDTGICRFNVFSYIQFPVVAADIVNMKHFVQTFLVLGFLLCPLNVFCADADIPPLLAGVWQNSSRMIVFDNRDSPQIILKLFYGWYYDRILDMSADAPARPRNAATSRNSEQVSVSFEPLIPETETSGAWNLHLYYSGFKEEAVIPVAVFGGNLYVDFMLNRSDADGTATLMEAASNISGITVSFPQPAEEVYSFLRTDNAVYRIRYWQTDMEYDGETEAVLSVEEGGFPVPKHLLIGSTVYTCVPGRGTVIRNIERLPESELPVVSSPDNRICVLAPPYVTAAGIPGDTVRQVVTDANSRQRPPREPLIPPGDLDFRYDVISELRKYTPNFSEP